MGLAASQARLLMLYSRKSDLEFLVQNICQQEQMMMAQVNTLAMQQSNLYTAASSSNPEQAKAVEYQIKSLDNRQAVLHNHEKYLETLKKQYETQHQAVQTEVESVKKVIDKNIELSFKYFA